MVQRDKSCYLLRIKRLLGSWKKPQLEPFALSALSVEIPDCKTWKWPSPAALEFTFTRKNKKNQSIKVSACLAPWKIRYSISCSRRAGEIPELMGGWEATPSEKQHWSGATTCQVLCGSPVPPGVVGGSVSPRFADSGPGSSRSQVNLQQECAQDLPAQPVRGAQRGGFSSCSAERFMLCLVALLGHSVIFQLAEHRYK